MSESVPEAPAKAPDKAQFAEFREARTAADLVREKLPTLELRARTMVAIDIATAAAAGVLVDALSATPDQPGVAPLIAAVLGSFFRPAWATARNLDVPTQEPKDTTVLARRHEGNRLDERTWVHALVASAKTGFMSDVAQSGRDLLQRRLASKEKPVSIPS